MIRLRRLVIFVTLIASIFALVNKALATPTTITIVPGASDYTSDLKSVFATAPAGSTIKFLKGTYNVAKGTSYVIYQPLTITGSNSTVVNAHFLFLANVTVNGLSLNENECIYKSTNPSACPVYPPMITLGTDKYAITAATITNFTMNFSRAYTGIAFGGGPTENISISNFSIVDNEMSGITGLSGQNITISNGTIHGGSDANVDDGIALYSATASMSNVTISNITANNTFDAIGIATLMYYPMHDIKMSKTTCQQTAVCIYVKAGDSTAPPKQYAGYSTLDRFDVEGVTDTDTTGGRYLSTVWIYAKGGAIASDVTVNNVTASTRAATHSTPRIWLFTDAKSKINNATFTNMNLVDKNYGAAKSATIVGQPTGEGLFLQDQGKGNISDVKLTSVNVNGTAYYAIDSSLAKVNGLSVSNCKFTNIDKAQTKANMNSISYGYSQD